MRHIIYTTIEKQNHELYDFLKDFGMPFITVLFGYLISIFTILMTKRYERAQNYKTSIGYYLIALQQTRSSQASNIRTLRQIKKSFKDKNLSSTNLILEPIEQYKIVDLVLNPELATGMFNISTANKALVSEIKHLVGRYDFLSEQMQISKEVSLLSKNEDYFILNIDILINKIKEEISVVSKFSAVLLFYGNERARWKGFHKTPFSEKFIHEDSLQYKEYLAQQNHFATEIIKSYEENL
jgi:hypothetical protein